jgi:DNA polymerase III delta subunit
LDYVSLLRSVQTGRVPPVLLAHGTAVQLLDDLLALVSIALFPDPAAAAFGREVVDGRETGAHDVVRSALTLPLGAPSRLVAVRHAQGLAGQGADALGAYARDPNPTSCLLLLADEPLGGGRDRKPHWLLGALPPDAVVELAPRRGRALEQWLRERAGGEGLAVSEEAARLLVDWIGEDTAALLGEARKAALAGGPDNRAVGRAEVAAVVGEHRVGQAWDLTNAVERGDRGAALRALEQLLLTEEPMFLLAMLTRHLRTAWTIREWHRKGRSVEQIAGTLHRPPAVVQTILDEGGDFAAQLARCWDVELSFKSGGEPSAELAMLVAELCGKR